MQTIMEILSLLILGAVLYLSGYRSAEKKIQEEKDFFRENELPIFEKMQNDFPNVFTPDYNGGK